MGRKRLKVSVDGLGELERELKRVSEGAERGAGRAVESELEATAADMRAGAPVDSGELVDSIGVEHSGTEGGITIGADHWPYVEHGTSTHGAQPFATPAAEGARSRLPGTVSDEVRGEL